jgi:GT2 family glycosyltransferase
MILPEAFLPGSRFQAATPLCTLVIATCGRTDLLVECLHSIPLDERRYFPILVVDQNDAPLLSAKLGTLAQQMDLTHFRVPFRNASRARNFGAAHSRTPWLAFPDDDCRFLEDTLATFRQKSTDVALDLLAGQVVDHSGQPHIIPWLLEQAELQPDGYERCFAESTFFIRKTLFDHVHGFDDRFGPGATFPSNEGGDLLCRLWQSGLPFRSLYTPELRFFHPDKDTGRSPQVYARVENFAFGEGAFTLRHRSQLPTRKITRRLTLMLIGLLIGRGDARRRLVYLKGFLRGALTYLRQVNTPTPIHAWTNPHDAR